MIVVIQCAAGKSSNAGFFRTTGGRKVLFVANPAIAPQSFEYLYARPDDTDTDGITWREKLLRYNDAKDNPFGLCRACDLYDNQVYRRLVARFGKDKTFILSAGWGLIGAAFLTPMYDITFSSAVRKSAPYKLRQKRDVYRDFSHLPPNSNDTVIFFGGKDYVPLFTKLTRSYRGKRIVLFNSSTPPEAPDCVLQRHETATRTNWHYECANAFLDGQSISIALSS